MQKTPNPHPTHSAPRNVPPPTMEQFCRALHPDLDVGPTCLSWFRQATDHCTDLILGAKGPGTFFWTTVKNFIFPDRRTELLNQKIPISVHPTRLSVPDCHALFLDIVHDYIERAPRYAAASAANALLWQILYSLMGIMALGSLLVSTIIAYRRFGRFLRGADAFDLAKTVFAPERRMRAAANRSLRIARCELRRLRLRHVVQPEELVAPDGSATLVMRLGSRLNLVDSVVSGQPQAMGRLFRLHDLMGRKHTKPDFKVETVGRAMRFLSGQQDVRKLRVLFVFDEEPLLEQLTQKRKRQSPPKFGGPTTGGGSMKVTSSRHPGLTSQASSLSATPSHSCSMSVSASPSMSPLPTLKRFASSYSPRSGSPPACKRVGGSPRPAAPTHIPRPGSISRRSSSFNLKK